MHTYRTIAALALFLGVALGLATTTRGAEDIDVRPAQAAALEWLGAIDAGRYGESWDAAAPTFKGVITRPDWEKQLVALREPLGAPVARKLRSATYSTTIPGAPAGEYVVIVYDTHFGKRPGTVETITPTRQPDGTWKVSGYFLR